MKSIHVTFISTPGHGYLSISKKDFLAIGADPEKISQYSGHTFTRLYLEEDCDASYLVGLTREKGIHLAVKHSYNESFSIHHNYKPELFSYTPQVGDAIDIIYTVKSVDVKQIVILHTGENNKPYRIPSSNPFKYIHSFKRSIQRHSESTQAAL